MTAFGRVGEGRRNAAALFGGFVPDLSLYALAGVAILWMGVPAETVFREYYYSPAWQQIFKIDNSFVIWGAVLVVALWTKRHVLSVFAASGLLHIALDFPFHNDDARPHFWPISDWVFESPVSYWDPAHYGGMIGWVEWLACAVCLAALWRRFSGWVGRSLVLLAAVVQVAPMLAWRILF